MKCRDIDSWKSLCQAASMKIHTEILKIAESQEENGENFFLHLSKHCKTMHFLELCSVYFHNDRSKN